MLRHAGVMKPILLNDFGERSGASYGGHATSVFSTLVRLEDGEHMPDGSLALDNDGLAVALYRSSAGVSVRKWNTVLSLPASDAKPAKSGPGHLAITTSRVVGRSAR